MSLRKVKNIDNRFIVDMEDKLGQGTYSEVFRAYDQQNPESQLCVKVIPVLKYHKNPTTLKNIKREIDSLLLLKQYYIPNVVSLIAYYVTKNNMYMFLEYCNGGSLEELLQKRIILTETEVVIILKEIAQAFIKLHELKLIHRDLKPANILMHNKVFKVADFGFSRIIQQISDEPMKVSCLGSPLYMSPQLLINSQTSEGKCDIWSLGIIAYEMLYGKCPYETEDLQKLINLLKSNDKIQFPKNFRPARSQKIKSLISKMLEKDEKNRITWEELLQDDIFKFNENYLLRNEQFLNQYSSTKLISSLSMNNIYNNYSIDTTQKFSGQQQLPNQKIQKIENNLSENLYDEKGKIESSEEQESPQNQTQIFKDSKQQNEQKMLANFQYQKEMLQKELKLQKDVSSIEETLYFKRDMCTFLDRIRQLISQTNYSNQPPFSIILQQITKFQLIFLKQLLQLLEVNSKSNNLLKWFDKKLWESFKSLEQSQVLLKVILDDYNQTLDIYEGLQEQQNIKDENFEYTLQESFFQEIKKNISILLQKTIYITKSQNLSENKNLIIAAYYCSIIYDLYQQFLKPGCSFTHLKENQCENFYQFYEKCEQNDSIDEIYSKIQQQK